MASTHEAHKGLEGVSTYAPDSFFVSGAASPPKANVVIHGDQPGGRLASPEWPAALRKSSGSPTKQRAGHRQVHRRPGGGIYSNWQFQTGRGMWWGKLSIDGYRDMGASVMGVYAVNFLGLAMQAVTFNMPQQEIRYYSGANSTAA